MLLARTDVVGSLLRPPELIEARDRLTRGMLSPAEFKQVEDRAVDTAVALQEAAGLEVVTDGEMRRLSFQSQLTEAVQGFAPHDLDAFLWGEWKGDETAGNRTLERPRSLGVVEKLTPRRSLSGEEFTYLRARTGRIAKVTLPSPSLFANFWDGSRSGGPYPTLEAFLADVVDILRREVEELVRLGATYIQLDAPHYTGLLEPGTRAFYEGLGWPAQKWLEQGIDMDNSVMAGHPGVTFGFHLCRGNQGSRWLVEGSYEALARPIFRSIGAQRILLEYDDVRSGSFEPLREMPEDKVAVLGLVTTKSPRRETPAELAARVREAGRFMPLERLALSPQCGFSTSVMGNRITEQDQREKLTTLVQAAREVW